MQMGYRSATDLSTSAFLRKFYALKAGDNPKVLNIDLRSFSIKSPKQKNLMQKMEEKRAAANNDKGKIPRSLSNYNTT